MTGPGDAAGPFGFLPDRLRRSEPAQRRSPNSLSNMIIRLMKSR